MIGTVAVTFEYNKSEFESIINNTQGLNPERIDEVLKATIIGAWQKSSMSDYSVVNIKRGKFSEFVGDTNNLPGYGPRRDLYYSFRDIGLNFKHIYWTSEVVTIEKK